MANLTFPIIAIDGSHFQVEANLEIYTQEAITSACYKYAGVCYVHQLKNGNVITITFESKDGSDIPENIVKQFCSDLVDQQLRVDTNKQFGHIRDLIVEEAFKPISK